MTRPTPRPTKLLCIVSAWPRNTMKLPRGRSFFAWFNQRLNVVQHAAEVASVHVAKDVNDRRDVVMREHRRLHGARDGGDVGENLSAARAGRAGVDGRGVQRLDGIHRVFRHAGVDEILHAEFLVHPVRRRHLAAAAQAQQAPSWRRLARSSPVSAALSRSTLTLNFGRSAG